MTTTLPTPVPVAAPVWHNDRCRTCGLSFEEWDGLDPLFRPWSVYCPDCTRDAIADDHRLARLEDR